MAANKKVMLVMTSKGIEIAKVAKDAVALLVADGLEGVTIKRVLAGAIEQVQLVGEDEVAAALTALGQEVPDEYKTAGDPALTNKEDGKEAGKAEGDTPADKPADKPSDPPKDEKGTNPPTDAELEYPEVGHFKDEKAMKKYTKKLTDAQLFDWCELEGVTWKRCPEHEPIDRMRAAMAIKAKHFPHTAPKATSKSKSKYLSLIHI